MIKRNLKLFLASLLGVVSMSFLAGTPSQTANASLDNPENLRNISTATQTFGEFNKLGTYDLFKSSSTETKRYYTLQYECSTGLGSYTFECNKDGYALYSSAKVISGFDHNARATTSFTIPDNFVQASKNGYLNIKFQGSFCTKDNGSYDNPDKIFARISNNEVNLDAQTTSVSDTAFALNFSNAQTSDFTVIFASEYVKSGWNTGSNEMRIKSPQIIISSSDTTAPVVTNVIYDNNWSAENKIVTFGVSESESGLQYVRLNGENISPNAEGIYSFEAVQDMDYSIDVCDNIGNYSSHTISSADLKIDTTGVSNVTISDIADTHEDNFSFNVDYAVDNHSTEKIYYKLMTETEYKGLLVTPSIDDTWGTLKLGNNSLSLVGKSIGRYYLCVIVRDAVGHESSLVTKNFYFDNTRYLISVSANFGDYEISAASKINDETEFHAWFGDTITIEYTPHIGYEFYKLLRNGVEMNAGENKYIFTCDSTPENIIDIQFRYRVNILNYTDTYVFDETGNLNFEYTLNSDSASINIETFVDDTPTALLNVGEYIVKWDINTDDFIGGGELPINVLPKPIVLEFYNTIGHVYNGEIQNINHSEYSGLQFITNYYYFDSATNTYESTNCDFRNAGKYKVNVVPDNSNYVVENGELTIEMAKKNVVASVLKTEFNYTASNIQIEYNLDSEIDVIIDYQIYDANIDTYINSDFKNSGDYIYTIEPLDTQNYIISNDTGNAKINQVAVRFELNKYIYDYTANNVVPDYVIYDSNNNIISFVNNLELKFTDNSGEISEFNAVGKYSLEFATIDPNYILNNTNFENLIIKMTIVNVELVTSTYEYTGTSIALNYLLRNEDGDKLDNAGNINLTITTSGEIVDEIRNVGEYQYEFSSSDVNYEINGATGCINIIPARLHINMKSEYVYNENGYICLSSIISDEGVSFGGNPNITVTITQNGEACELTDVGEYSFEFVSADENIVLVDGFAGIIKIIPQTVELDIVTTYTFTGELIDFEYSNPLGIDISVEIDDLLNAGNYSYKITSNNNNYTIDNGDGVVIINPKEITILALTKNYEFSNEIIAPLFSLEQDIEYEVLASQDGISVDIFSIGNYSIDIVSKNSNYIILDSTKKIIVSPKNVTINVDENSISLEYNGQILGVTAEIEDNVPHHIEYSVDEQTIEPINVGEYNFSIILDDSNYAGLLNGVFTITPKDVSLVIASGQQKTYGDSDQLIEYSLPDIVSGDIVNVELSRDLGENVGVYAISMIGWDNDNYNVIYSEIGYFKIVAKRIIVIADKQSKIFGELDSELTYKIYMNNGIVSKLIGDDILSGGLVRLSGENVGSYDIDQGDLNNNNYQIVFIKSQYQITPKEISVKISNKSVVYGQSETLDYIVNDDVDISMIFGNIEREAGEDVGEYAITQGSLNSKNYILNVVPAKYIINPKPITIEALNAVKTYGEADNLNYVVTGLVGDDTLTGELIREIGEDVGEYAVLQGTLANKNYDITFSPAILTISKAKLDIIIDNVTQEYSKPAKTLTYSVSGLKFDDQISLKLFRESGEDVGNYDISCKLETLNNYLIGSLTTGKYTITKSTITPLLKSKTCVYNGKAQNIDIDNFPYPVELIYKLNGFKVDNAIDAGEYTVQAVFAGNQNYAPSKSAISSLIIDKQLVYLTLLDNNYIYNGEVKYPKYSFDKTIGISENSIIYEFENNIEPKEVGEYRFNLKVADPNFKGETQGIIKIQKSFEYMNSNSSTISCEDATFDANVQALKLIESVGKKSFNNEKVVSICSLENVENISSDYVYTVKVKATQGIDNVHVYRVDLDGFEELACSVENGYYIFKVSDIESKYFVTTEVKTLNTLAWIIIITLVIITFGITLIVVTKKKHKHALAEKDTETTTSNDLDTYNLD